MRKLMHAFVLALVLGIGFASGYWFRDWRSRSEMEDYALSGVLENFGHAAYIDKGDTTRLRDLIDINLNGHLAWVRQFQGSAYDEQFADSRIRALNAAARLWDGRPPFTTLAESSRWRFRAG